MKILVIGSGGREHAICWKIRQSKLVDEIFCIPGNAGIQKIANCVDIKIDDVSAITEFAISESVDLTIIGPEIPLVLGLTDMLNDKGLKVFGPNKEASQFEGSKAYTKKFMEKYNIPSAKYEIYNNVNDALYGLKDFNTPIVVKADGLAAGKGVLICATLEEAESAVNAIMSDKQFGEAGDKIVVEEFLTGTETSLLCFVDGNNIIPMESARDYKKAYDNDEGLNTGGMGCFSPNPIYTESLKTYINKEILENIMNGFKAEEIDYHGILFIGLMIEDSKAKVLEFNVRFGDPETQVILPRLKSDLIDIMMKTINGNLSESDLIWDNKESVTVVLASGGYPNNYEKGKIITGLDSTDDDIIIFHAGTRQVDGSIVTNGGRVLNITCLDDNIESARAKIYKSIDLIDFFDKQFRTDIGKI